jgi:hypothetical protein
MSRVQNIEIKESEEIHEQTLKKGHEELKRLLKKNKSLITIIDGLLDKLDKEDNYPFLLIEMNENILPNLVGEKATQFLSYVLEKGYNFDLSDEIDLELHMLVKKYGITYLSALRFIHNPLDYVSNQFILNKERNQMTIRFIRSDRQTFTFDLDNESLASMISGLLDYLSAGIRNSKEDLPSQSLNELMFSISNFLDATHLMEQVDENEG